MQLQRFGDAVAAVAEYGAPVCGEMEVWTLKSYDASYARQEIRSVSSSSPRVTAELHPKADAFDYTVTVVPIDTAEKLSTIVMIETDYPPDAPKSYPVHVRVK